MKTRYLKPVKECPDNLAMPYWEYRMVRNPYDNMLREGYECNVCGDTFSYADLDYCPFCPNYGAEEDGVYDLLAPKHGVER